MTQTLTHIPLHVENITVRYPNGTVAVSNLSLTVNPGEVFGLVGPNGAGKTSLLKCAAGLIQPRVGSVRCGEIDVTANPQQAATFLSLMPDPLGVYNDLSASEYLEFFARALRIPESDRQQRIDQVVERLELNSWLDHEVETLSAGWQRRLALGRILLADSPILLLDEPAAGLDISARSSLLRIVRSVATEGRTVIISSHILPELEQLADRFGIIQQGSWAEVEPGKIFFTQADLARGFGKITWRIRCSDAVRAKKVLGEEIAHDTDEPQTLTLSVSNDEEAAGVLHQLVTNGIHVYDFQQQTTDLAELALKTLDHHSESTNTTT